MINQRVPDNWSAQPNEPFPEIQLDADTISFNTTIPMRELHWTPPPPQPLVVHGDGGIRANGNPPPLPAVGGTLESVVNQAATNKRKKHVPWGRRRQRAAAPVASSDTTSLQAAPPRGVDAMVPCNNTSAAGGPGGSYLPSYGNCSATHAGSCSADAGKGYPRGGGPSMTVSATFETESRQLTVETSQLEMMSQGFTFTTGSLGNTSSAANQTMTTDSASHSINERDLEIENDSRKGKSSPVPVKKNRAAAVHNQSERKRRDRINERMRTLQKMVPNASKTDKASMLGEVIDYMKQLQAQISIMTRVPSFMMQHFHLLSMMGMGMNMGMGVGMGMGITGGGGMMPPPNMAEVLPPYFMSPSGWEGFIGHGSDVQMQTVPAVGVEVPPPHPFNAFLVRQQDEAPSVMESAARMSALYQQFQQGHGM